MGREKERVTLVHTLLIDPDFILADETISAPKASLRVEMRDLGFKLHFDELLEIVRPGHKDPQYPYTKLLQCAIPDLWAGYEADKPLIRVV